MAKFIPINSMVALNQVSFATLFLHYRNVCLMVIFLIMHIYIFSEKVQKHS